jgi:arginyl-tRNA synthetase
VVGLPQRLHLEMIYQTAREAGWLKPPARSEHVGHGSVLGSDGKLLRTRAGGSVKLTALLDEAVARAGALVAEKNPRSTRPSATRLPARSGSARSSTPICPPTGQDYVRPGPMLALDGTPRRTCSTPRLIRSIFRRAGTMRSRWGGAGGRAGGAGAGVELLGFAGVVREVSDTLELHRLAGHLYRLAVAFMAFYEKCPVLAAGEPAVRAGRLVLCDLTARTLRRGLDLLGISTPDRM